MCGCSSEAPYRSPYCVVQGDASADIGDEEMYVLSGSLTELTFGGCGDPGDWCLPRFVYRGLLFTIASDIGASQCDLASGLTPGAVVVLTPELHEEQTLPWTEPVFAEFRGLATNGEPRKCNGSRQRYICCNRIILGFQSLMCKRCHDGLSHLTCWRSLGLNVPSHTN